VEAFLFWTFAAVSVAGSAVTITRKNPLASALALAVVLVAIAGLFAMLDAHLLFILQILVYAGAIVVLIVFVIMLLNLGEKDLREMRIQPVKFAASAVVCAVGCILTLRALRGLPDLRRPASPEFGTAEAVSLELFGPFLVPFEVLGVILLIGIVGAVLLAKKGN
jgi:NADH-quinone oxidoreductase subunit J